MIKKKHPKNAVFNFWLRVSSFGVHSKHTFDKNIDLDPSNNGLCYMQNLLPQPREQHLEKEHLPTLGKMQPTYSHGIPDT